jgi:threonine dehydrogenase-like Zn-dependent dehydrogenase
MELLCRVDSVFICGTDPHIIKGDYHRFPLSAFPDALATFVGRKDGAIKVLIKP